MEKLDRLGWAVGMPFAAFGVRFGIRATTYDMLERALGVLPPGSKPLDTAPVSEMFSLVAGGATRDRTTRRLYVVYKGWVRVARHRELEPVLQALASELRLHVAEHSPNRVFVHAGVVGWQGRAIVIPGRSYSGKSTLVDALVRAGATYYSDEYAVFDRRGRVHPFPSPLAMREPGGFEQTSTAVAAGTKPLPLGLVAVTAFKEGVHFRPRALGPSEAALELMANTVSARRDPAAALAAFRAALAGASTLKGRRGEADEVTERILSLASASPTTSR